MWAKFSSALRSTTTRHVQDDTQSNNGPGPSQSQSQSQIFSNQSQSQSRSQAEVMARILEQHPNLSNFHNSDGPAPSQSSPPPSPSRRTLFKRSKDSDSVRAPTPSLKLLPKKIRGNLPFGNASQSSLASPTVETHAAAADEQPTAKHKTQPSSDTIRSFASVLRRPSLDLLRSVTQESSRPSLDSPVDNKYNSVRSILRDPKTPGTGQNVRFFSRDAYKVISPDESMEENFLSAPEQLRPPEQASFMDRLSQAGPGHSSTPARLSPPGTKSRPSLSGVFGPLETSKDEAGADGQSPTSEHSTSSMSLSGPVSPPNFNANGSLDVSGRLELPPFPPGLGFDVGSPLLDSAIDLDFSISASDSPGKQMTSTPFKARASGSDSGKGKEKEDSIKEEEQEDEEDAEKELVITEPVIAPKVVDETIFHAKERSPTFLPPFHERSQSFSFGQTVFYSMGKPSPATALSPAYASSDQVRPSEDGSAGPSLRAGVPRTRALSDTVFQDMLKVSSPGSVKSSDTAPEADINDESSQELILYASPVAEPDPFSANANTYYTPQTMIPTTPPQGLPRHTRKTSKEENLIYSLQTQLALQTELCSQYETDLRTKDQMVELLEKKVGDLEKQENQRKGALRQWKKKVQELERAVRLLEEEVDSSRQESMERSIMDEASGEALRMLHRQIASLEREKKEWEKKEHMLKGEVETLEVVVKERSQDVSQLKEMLWNRDEELDHGLREAKEQIDMLGNISLVGVDEEELRRLAEKEHRAHEERQAYRAAEIGWEQERAELMMKLETMQVEKKKVEDQLDTWKQQTKTKEDEFDVMKAELEAQWGHSETASERIQELQMAKNDAEENIARLRNEKEEVMQERDEWAQKYEEVDQRVGNLELDWNESENKKMELEAEVQELWELKEAMEKERETFEEQLEQERGHSEGLTRALHQCEERIAQLEQESQFTTENVARLEENIRRRDEEIAEYSQKVHAQELEAENLQEELGKLQREHSRVVDEQSRALKEAAGSEGEARKQLQDLVRQKAEGDVELKSSQDRLQSLKNEMERLRRHVHELQQESADKEVKIVQFTKQHAQDKEDIQGLNIALDAKQQELELYKRKMAIKTSSVGTPASSTSKVLHRRDSSSVFDSTPSATTRPPSRAASVVSDTGSAKGETKVSALGKSSRINTSGGTSTTGSAIKKRVEGSMGPPPLKPRSSGTPTPAARPASALARSTAAKSGPITPVPHRRVASGTIAKAKTRPSGVTSPTSSISELSEKENVDDETKAVRRRSMIPAPV